jgi:hypothetical protein
MKQFTLKTNEYLKNLPVLKIWDRQLATTEDKYHLYMIEIELANRMNQSLFQNADRKISLQPYCLQDLTANCKASRADPNINVNSVRKSVFKLMQAGFSGSN